MSDILLRNWTIKMTEEQIQEGNKFPKAEIAVKDLKKIVDNLDRLLRNEGEHLAEHNQIGGAASCLLIGINEVRAIETPERIKVMEHKPRYAVIDSLLNSHPNIVTNANAVLQDKTHDDILRSLILLRHHHVMTRQLEAMGCEELAAFADSDRLSREDILFNLAGKWARGCEESLQPYYRVHSVLGTYYDYQRFVNKYEHLNIQSHEMRSIETIAQTIDALRFVSAFIQQVANDAEAQRRDVVPLCDFSEAKKIRSTHKIFQGICLAAHLYNPGLVPQFIALSNLVGFNSVRTWRPDGPPPG